MPILKSVKKFALKFQDFFSAAAFAEEGDAGTAREIVREKGERLSERKQTIRRELNARSADRPILR